MKKFGLALAAAVLLVLVNGCVAPVGYGGSYGAVYGEYPSTYSGTYYSSPGYYYPNYSYGYYHHWAPYDRDHYWDRNHYWDRHAYGQHWYRHVYEHRDRDDRYHH